MKRIIRLTKAFNELCGMMPMDEAIEVLRIHEFMDDTELKQVFEEAF